MPYAYHVTGITMSTMDSAALTKLEKSMVPVTAFQIAMPQPKRIGTQIIACGFRSEGAAPRPNVVCFLKVSRALNTGSETMRGTHPFQRVSRLDGTFLPPPVPSRYIATSSANPAGTPRAVRSPVRHLKSDTRQSRPVFPSPPCIDSFTR
jgi:hypothetical protein